MKSFINKIVVIAACLPLVAQAQLDRTNPPKPLPAREVKITDPATFTLPNGLKVFVVSSKKLPKISATLTLDIGAIKEGEKAGYVSLAGQMMMRGTKTKTKAQLDEAIDIIGSTVVAGSSSVYGSSLTTNFDKVLDLMSDITFNPAFSDEELEKLKKQALSGLEQQKESPDAIASNVSKVLTYGANHPYGEIETIESVKKVTIKDVQQYYKTYWKPNIGYLVFVGDITVEKAKLYANKYFGKWAKGVVPKTNITFPNVTSKTLIAVVDRPQSVQSKIDIIAPIVLKPGDVNVVPARVTASILGGGASGRLYKNLREAHGFTYGAYSGLSSDKHIGTFSASASVRNEKTDSAIGEFFNEFNRIRKQPVTEDEVFMVKKEVAGSFARSLEQPGTVADFALSVAKNNLPKDYYKNYIKYVDAVNVATVQQVANQFIKPSNMIVVIVGNAKQIAAGLEKYGEVKYFDLNGNPTKAPSTSKPIPDGVTAASIIGKYIDAVGGSAAIAGLKDLTLTGEALVTGAPPLSFSQKYLVGKSFKNEINMGPRVLLKQMAKNGEFVQQQQGQNMELKDEDKEEMSEEVPYINEIYYQKNGYKLNPKAIEEIEGEDVYAVEITSAKGRTFTNYYSVATGLKLKSIKVVKEDGKEMIMGNTYSDYKVYNGIKIPMKVITDNGMKITTTVKDVKLDSGLTDADF